MPPAPFFPPWNCVSTEDQVISAHMWGSSYCWGSSEQKGSDSFTDLEVVSGRGMEKTSEKKSTGISWYQWDHILRVSAFMTLNYISVSSFPTFQNHILPKLIWII